MTSNVIDTNVWIALLFSAHPHHRETRVWAEHLQEGEAGLCRAVELSVVRLISSRSVMGADVVAPAVAWERMQQILEDERFEFLTEPAGIDRYMVRLLTYAEPTPKLVNDAYLAAFAIAGNRKLVTRDRGFLEFRGLQVELL